MSHKFFNLEIPMNHTIFIIFCVESDIRWFICSLNGKFFLFENFIKLKYEISNFEIFNFLKNIEKLIAEFRGKRES